MAHTHDVYDTGKHFEINGISRFIRETSTTKLVLVQGDHKSEVVTFKMPRYIDGHDMLLCNKIRVHYINIEPKTNNSSADIYEVTDLKLCEDCAENEEETLLFTWTIEAPATKYFGSLSFLVKFECTEGENILYQWNTARYVNVNVLSGIDNSEAFVDKYSNVLEEWYSKLMGESEIVTNFVENAGQQLEDCKNATNSCVSATEDCISATEDAESVRAGVEAGGYIESLKEMNNNGKFSFWVGTKAEYEALEKKVANRFYIITDDPAQAEFNELKSKAHPFQESEDYSGCYYRMVDGEIEWMNPPMRPDVEYRTTERHIGRPVYVKRVQQIYFENIGNISPSDCTDFTIQHGISNLTNLIRCNAVVNGRAPLPFISKSGGITSVNDVNATNIVLRIYKDTWTKPDFIFDIAYTKGV